MIKSFIFPMFYVLSACTVAEETRHFKWPDSAQAAVSLSYDDALHSQLEHAIPALDNYGFKASFYLTLSSQGTTQHIERWRSVAKNGHELGNHTVFHSCSKTPNGRDWVSAENNLDVKTLKQIQQELTIANAFLQALDGKVERTFTVPCGDSHVSDGNYVESVRQSFVAIKGNNPQYHPKFDLLLTPENVDGKTLIAFVEEVREQGGIANILFHGIDGDYLSVSQQAHNELLSYLADNKNSYWVDTYLNIMKYVKHAHEG